MIDYRGARGSNTGDDFHELWAIRQAIRLLTGEDDLHALSVEGVLESGRSTDTWDGVDCALYLGGPDAASASQVRIEQLKYSGSSPGEPWTVARLTYVKAGSGKAKEGKAGSGKAKESKAGSGKAKEGKAGSGKAKEGSVIARLAKAWKAMSELRPGAPPPGVALVTNQPVAPELWAAVLRARTAKLTIPKRDPDPKDADEVKLAHASGLTPEDFREFAVSLDLESNVGSRFAIEDRVLKAIAAWTDQDARGLMLELRQFVRQRMLPENDRAPITRDAVLVSALGMSDAHALFPCPADLARTERPVRRVVVDGATRLLGTRQYLCLHGEGGVGKTTALQQIEEDLPARSVMVVFDCYGGGRYLDPAALRHRPADAFVQLANEVATKLRLPLLLSRHGTSDFPRLFVHRLRHAAEILAAASPKALLVIAIDAADNSVAAARERGLTETSFVHDFVLLRDLPLNVRFVVTARTGRLPNLRLPGHYERMPLGPFTPGETAENVRRRWAAPESWIKEFHRLSNGIPRVQSYAFKEDAGAPEAALERLRPGKSLADVFEERFREALAKNGNPQEVASLCAGLVALARPVPVAALAEVLELPKAQVRDMCSDLVPGIRLEGETVGFADEDFEAFVSKRAEPELKRVRGRAASWLLSQARNDSYAAIHVAPALAAAERFFDLLALVEEEPCPAVIRDPIQRREAEVKRLRLALSASRAAGSPSRALRYVLLGAEGVHTDDVLRSLLADNPDLAARFATDTIGRVLLSDPDHRPKHGQLLLHQLVVHAERGDAISYREGMRLIGAWMEARKSALSEPGGPGRETWPLDAAAVAADAEAAFKLKGPMAALRQLERWRPRSVQIEVALALPPRLITEGRAAAVEVLLGEGGLGPTAGLFLRVPLALAGRPIDPGTLETGLVRLSRRVGAARFLDGFQERDSLRSRLVDILLTGCEVLTARDPSRACVDAILDRLLEPERRRIDLHHTSFSLQKLDVVFRAYALREVRAGRVPAAAGIFEPRLREELKGSKRRRGDDESAERHDRDLHEFTEAVFPVYAVVGCALAGLQTGERVVEDLKRAAGSFRQTGGRWRDPIGFSHAQTLAARQLLVLLATDYDSTLLMGLALGIDGAWREGHGVPDQGLVSRLSLRGELHEALVTVLEAAATTTSEIRMGAREKSDSLVRHARLLVPLSRDDAGQVFRLAVSAAGELDTEGRAQLVMIEELVRHAGEAVPDRRRTALAVGEVIADAAVRLGGYGDFPWRQSMDAFARLDAPLALAAVSRWDALGTINLSETLPAVLRASLETGALNPGQASALALALEHDDKVLEASLARARAIGDPNLGALREEAARDLLVRPGRSGAPSELVGAPVGPSGPLAEQALARERFVRTISHPAPEPRPERPSGAIIGAIARYAWKAETVVDVAALASAVQAVQDRAREEKAYLSEREILASARAFVPMRDRSRHLDALLEMGKDDGEGGVVPALASALDAWPNPGVNRWCEVHLPSLVMAWLPRLARGLPYFEGELKPFLSRTGLSAEARRDLLFEGIQRHVDALAPGVIFGLVAYIGGMLADAEVADVLDWYVGRLASRIAERHLEKVGPCAHLPVNATEAAARFAMAQMGSPDTRARWRAAHAVRRLARTGERETIAAFAAQCGRQEEPVFSCPSTAFYALAARLWAVIALDRVSGECPDVARVAGRVLLNTALDDSFPHLLVRAFARDACDKLVAAGVLSPTPAERERLARVNESPLARVKVKDRYQLARFRRERESQRFSFDPMDTLPYWYQPMLRSFAGLDGDRFLNEAERWIVDVWGWSQSAVDEVHRLTRRFRLERDWALMSHRQGSRPTIESLRTHLEWHAMWCAAGELAKTVPLPEFEPGDWDDLGSRVRREQVSERPLWSADLLVPIPLHARHWLLAGDPLPNWIASVTEPDHRLALFPPERPDYIVVDGYERTTAGDRSQAFRVSSALVEPATAPALLRALQTMQSSWEYKLPDEGEDQFEINEPPYRLLGWLLSPQCDQGIDKEDPYNGYAEYVDALPGRRVQAACGLARDPSGTPRWSQDALRPPMFIHESWGEREEDEDRRNSGTRSVGRRLLAHREQVLEFLRAEDLDLVIEVEVTRRGRETQRYAGEEGGEPPEARFDRVYRLDRGGGLHIAEGHLGTWAGVGSQP